MKNVLLTTTALVAFAGAASAEVSLSGSAEMGLVTGAPYGDETQFHHDFDVKFKLSGESDNGLTFGATMDLDEVFGAGTDTIPTAVDIGGADVNDSSVFISGGFGTVTLGDTDGGFDWAMKEVGIGSAIADDHTTHAGYNWNSGADGTYDAQVLRYDNTFGEFGFAASVELDDTGAGDPALGLGVKYNLGLGGSDLGLGFGYTDNGTNDAIGVSLDATFGAIQAILNYTDGDAIEHIGVGLGYSADALTVSFNYGDYDGGADGYGMAVNYDLGGGAAVQFGYADDSLDQDRMSLGMAMSF